MTEIPAGVGVGDGVVFVTVIVAVPFLVESAVLVAVIVQLPVKLGAVYIPVLEIDPPLAVHVTLLLAAPPTLAVNCCVAPTPMVAVEGLTVTPLLLGGGVVEDE